MKQVIPFKKELLFKTNVSEITSISLEHNILSKSTYKIIGNFMVFGDYKMTEGSINREKFNFDIPFEINLDNDYDMDSIVVDIDNFYYEIVNNEILKVNIDVYLIGEKNKDKLVNNDDFSLEKVREDVIEKVDNNLDYNDIESIKYEHPKKVMNIDDKNFNIDTNDLSNNTDDVNDTNNINNNIFENIDSNDTYVTYSVYIVKEDDNIDKILDKFKVTREDLEKYNDITNIKEKDKIIIPCNFNE